MDSALDVILAQNLAVIVDIHPSDEFKIRLNKEDRHVEAFAQFWTSLAKHLSTRDPERVFLEVINEPMVEDPYRWYGIQAKLIAAIRVGAPEHTIIASGHRWSGLYELLSLQAYADPNIIYNFHFYEPFTFTHQGATWAGNNLPYFQKVPYPATHDGVMQILDTVKDEPARYVLQQYGESGWNAERIDREIGNAAAWAAKRHVFFPESNIETPPLVVLYVQRLAIPTIATQSRYANLRLVVPPPLHCRRCDLDEDRRSAH